MITKEMASDIYFCHQEIDRAKTLLKEAKEMIEKAESVVWGNAFGRPKGLELGIPSGENSRRLFDVSPSAALVVLADHIKNKEDELKRLNKQAKEALRYFSETD